MHGVKWGTKITQEELDHLHRLSALADEALERRQQHDLSKEVSWVLRMRNAYNQPTLLCLFGRFYTIQWWCWTVEI